MAAVLAASPTAVAEPPAKPDGARHERAVAAALRKLEAQLPLSAADHTALKTAAKSRKLDHIRVCGDPGNMPLSNENAEGFQNKIIELVARAMGARVLYFWRPYTERGLTRQTFDASECDVLLDMPAGYDGLLTTQPIYRTTYVFATRTDRNLVFSGLDDPRLKELRIGVFQTSGIRQALASRGVRNVDIHTLSHSADFHLEQQPWRQVQKVVEGKLDVAAVWGPFAGWLKAKGEPISLQPVNLMEDELPLEFDLSIGLRSTDEILKYKFELAIDENKAEIETILRSFGVPLVQCSRCFIAGDLPAHGVYTKPIPAAQDDTDPAALAERQRAMRAKVEEWLKDGADINEELANAVHAADEFRVRLLVEKGASVDKPDRQGHAPLHIAARHRKARMVELLLELKADPEKTDADGMSPLVHAIMRDDAASIANLARAKADLDRLSLSGLTPLAIAIIEDKLAAAMELIKAGASPDKASGSDGLTPLMLAAGKEPLHMTLGAGRRRIEKIHPQYPGTLEVARALIEAKADVNKTSKTGLTALMLAASKNQAPIVGLLVQAGADAKARAGDGRTALEIARANGNEQTMSLLRLLDQTGAN